ncbi:MAG: nucleotide exchange factor GrpE [Bacteroidetes bacterium]|nr:nucleotide exchange factor GrpE [Bacteroidota bacterium]
MTRKKVTDERRKQSEEPVNQGYSNSKRDSSEAKHNDSQASVESADQGEASSTGCGAVTESAGSPELKEKLAEIQDRYLRLSAEFDNYRKRTLREKMELTKTASESVLLKLLPVLDDFERGIRIMEAATDCNAMKEGIDLIYNKFRSFLEMSGVKEIEAINQVFNVDLHDAITKVPATGEHLKGKIVDVVEKGYMLNDKVIRFSKVVVGE